MQLSTFKPESERATALQDWWGKLETQRAQRAALARASSPMDVAFSEHYQNAWVGHFAKVKLNRAAMPAVLGLLARVREVDNRQLGVVLASGAADKARGLSVARFQRILQQDDFDEFYAALRRALDVVGRRAPILEVAELVHLWGLVADLSRREQALNEEQAAKLARYNDWLDRLKTELAYDYFSALPNNND